MTPADFLYVGRFLEGLFFGVYSGIFAVHVQYHTSKPAWTDNAKQNIIFYALCVLYVLSVPVIALDIAIFVGDVSISYDINPLYRLDIAQPILYGCCDFLAQTIYIYRCWIVWGYNIRVVILPSFLAFTYLVIWMVFAGAVFRFGQVVIVRVWTDIFVLTALAISMIVNPLVTGLIVFRIFKVFRAVKGSTSSDEKSLGVTGGEKLRSIIFIIMESDMPLFAIQLARVVTTTFVSRDPQVETLSLVVGIHQMLNGITPTIILLRVSMGLSFHDEPSLIDAVSSLRFAADDSDPIPRTGIMSRDEPHDTNPISEMIGTREERRDDDIGRSDDIQTVDA